jgi:hypothetical protein
MLVGVHRSRRIEDTERSFGAVESVELRKDLTAARLNPGHLEGGLVLRAQRKSNSVKNEGQQAAGRSAHIEAILVSELSRPSKGTQLQSVVAANVVGDLTEVGGVESSAKGSAPPVGPLHGAHAKLCARYFV